MTIDYRLAFVQTSGSFCLELQTSWCRTEWFWVADLCCLILSHTAGKSREPRATQLDSLTKFRAAAFRTALRCAEWKASSKAVTEMNQSHPCEVIKAANAHSWTWRCGPNQHLDSWHRVNCIGCATVCCQIILCVCAFSQICFILKPGSCGLN